MKPMNEADIIIKEWGGRMENALAECLRLRREKVQLYEMLIQSERYVTVHNQYGCSRYKRWWTEPEIDEELRNGRED